MKKQMLLIAILSVLIIPVSGYSFDKGFFISVGGVYAMEDFDYNELSDELIDAGFDTDFDDGMGLNAKLGYNVSENLAIGVDVDILKNFDLDVSTTILDIPYDVQAEVELLTGVAFLKLSTTGKFQPFISGGLGLMEGEATFNAELSGTDVDLSGFEENDDQDFCAKGSIGIDIKPIEKYAIGAEASYVTGFGDLDEISYSTITVYLSVNF